MHRNTDSNNVQKLVWGIVLLPLMIALISGCAQKKVALTSVKAKSSALSAKQSSSVKSVTVTNFDRVRIEGRLNASVHSGYSTPQVIARGNVEDLQQLVVKRTGNTLLASLGQGYPKHGPVQVEIRGKYIDYIAFEGDGSLKGTKLKSSDLVLDLNHTGTVDLNGKLMLRELNVRGEGQTNISGVNSKFLTVNIAEKAKVRVRGKANLRELSLHGDGSLDLHWTKGSYLKLRAFNNSVANLAGIVGKLDIELYDNAHFEGRYLRADNVFAKTFGNAVARISAVKRQHALASDASDIYFYALAEMRTDFMAFDGSVLDMRPSTSSRKEPTSLNKWL